MRDSAKLTIASSSSDEPESEPSPTISRYQGDIETALLELPPVAECAVLVRNASDKDVCVAYLVLRGSLARRKIEERLREAFPAARLPDHYAFVSRIPRTA